MACDLFPNLTPKARPSQQRIHPKARADGAPDIRGEVFVRGFRKLFPVDAAKTVLLQAVNNL
jgi:hypothetical protein